MAPPAVRAERAHLARAIALAQTAQAVSSPNPPVGCVLAVDGQLVAEGATRQVGGPHAEAVALQALRAQNVRGDLAAYVTLAPCAHTGRTPACADALIQAGVTRVVVAVDDPNPLARGGLDRLRAAGVSVELLDESDPFASVVRRQLEGHLSVACRGRPHVTLKIAQTASGATTASQGRWITGPCARRAVHRWRASVDAVLVGSQTVLVDDPRLDVRDAGEVAVDGRQPRAVVFDSRLRTPVDAAVVRPGTVVVTSADGGSGLRARGVDVVRVPPAPGGVDLDAAMSVLAEFGITTVLAEPGHRLATALLEHALVDRLVLHVADDDGHPRRAVDPGEGFVLERVGGAGPDAVLHWVRGCDPVDGRQAA